MRLTLILAPLCIAAPLLAQTAPPPLPGMADTSRIKAGTYTADTAHTQVRFTVDHLGFNSYHGLFGGATGTLTLDPARPAAARVSIDIPVAQLVTTSDALTKHMNGADFFDAARFPTVRFVSTRVVTTGSRARITGNLTLRGVTRPVVLDAEFKGAGDDPRSKAATVGFEAKTKVRRSEFGMTYGVPMVSDVVELDITAAFVRNG